MHEAYARPVDEVLETLVSDERRGLSVAEAHERIAEFGPNTFPEGKKDHAIILFLKQFHGALRYILFAAAALSFAMGEVSDGIGIIIAVLIDVVFGFVQERRAESALSKLKTMIVQEVTVLRDGAVNRVLARDVVPGDVMLVAEGDKVVADARLIDMKDLQCDESSLTGESVAVRKGLGVLTKDTPVGDRSNMVLMGTSVVAGTAKAVVVETGVRTEFGKIAASLTEIVQERTPFERRVDLLGRRLGTYAVGLSVVVLAAGMLRGFPLSDMFFFAVAMMVSVIPEGLPAVLAVVLAIGVQRMARKNAIVRHVPSVETLGVTDIICTDKTGTLTENKMTVREVVTAERMIQVTGEGWEKAGEFLIGGEHIRPSEVPEIDLLLKGCAVTNRASVHLHEGHPEVIGDPTEGALVVLAAKGGIEKMDLEKEYVGIDVIPFSSERKYQASLREHADIAGKTEHLAFVVGAYDVLAPRVASVMRNGVDVPFDAATRERFDAMNQDMAGRALRVLCVAMRRFPTRKSTFDDADVADLSLLGLVGMIDPPRPGVADAIARCRRAGVRVVMATGDQKATALAIGREIGLLRGTEADGTVLTEQDVAPLDDIAFAEAVESAAIFARVSPRTKLRIVTAFQDAGHTVAMTGDGVNDAPALKKASIGVAMGIAGTDVSREVADMVLADDNFVSIVNAIEEGRTVFTNVKDTTAYLFMTNVGEVVTVLASLAFGMPLPLLPAQILWMNLVTDGFPDIALATEPTDPNTLDVPPHTAQTRILSRNVLRLTALTSVVMCAGTLGLYSFALRTGDVAYARTVAFTAMCVFQLWNVFNMRSLTRSIFSIGFFTNVYVTAAVAVSVALQAAVLYVPGLQTIFRTVALGPADWLRILAVTFTVVVAIEVHKYLRRSNIIAPDRE